MIKLACPTPAAQDSVEVAHYVNADAEEDGEEEREEEEEVVKDEVMDEGVDEVEVVDEVASQDTGRTLHTKSGESRVALLWNSVGLMFWLWVIGVVWVGVGLFWLVWSRCGVGLVWAGCLGLAGWFVWVGLCGSMWLVGLCLLGCLVGVGLFGWRFCWCWACLVCLDWLFGWFGSVWWVGMFGLACLLMLGVLFGLVGWLVGWRARSWLPLPLPPANNQSRKIYVMPMRPR